MKPAVAVLLLLGLVTLVFYLGRWSVPPPPTITRIEYRDRPLQRRDTIRSEIPTTVIKYLPGRVDTISCDGWLAPVGFSPYGLVSRRPVAFDRGRVILTLINHSTGAYEQQSYTVPRYGRRLDPGLSAGLAYDPTSGELLARIRASVFYRRVGLVLGPELRDHPTTGADLSLFVGLEIRW